MEGGGGVVGDRQAGMERVSRKEGEEAGSGVGGGGGGEGVVGDRQAGLEREGK